MTIETDDDRLTLLEDWGEAATYGVHSITGIFDNGYSDVLDMDGAAPTFMCRTADVLAASMADGGALVLAVGNYTVRRLQHDGTGMTRLILEAQ